MTVRRMRKGSRYKHNAEFGQGSLPYCHISAIWLPIAGKVMVVLVHCSGIGVWKSDTVIDHRVDLG